MYLEIEKCNNDMRNDSNEKISRAGYHLNEQTVNMLRNTGSKTVETNNIEEDSQSVDQIQN